MDYHIRIEQLAYDTWTASVFWPVLDSVRARTGFLRGFQWLCIFVLLLPFQILVAFLVVIVGSFRLALANADRVIFVLATSILSFYQVPRKVFYIYIAVLVVTGFLQFLRIDSILRRFLLFMLDLITVGKANLFLRKFSGMHYSNPYTRIRTISRTIFFPVGYIVPGFSNMEVVKFLVSPDRDFFKKEAVVVGSCKITIRTLQGSSALQESSTVRSLRVEAPWGDNTVTFSMEDENLGRFVSYLDHVAANECKQVICSYSWYHGYFCRALTIAETIEYFNHGLSLVKLVRVGDSVNDRYYIN